jgi:hypothetical protein
MDYSIENKPQEGRCESYDLVKDKYVPCNEQGRRRVDNDLDSGIHCDNHWERLLVDCRKRSW